MDAYNIVMGMLPVRKPLRLANFDYSNAGAYFVTICVQHHIPRLGKIEKGEMKLNIAGKVFNTQWIKLPERFQNSNIDEFVLMPNHLHGIIWLLETNDYKVTLSRILQWYKSTTTNLYIKGVKENQWPRFKKRFWQVGFHDRIIRNERELNAVRAYIQNNPMNWELDQHYRKI